MKGKGMRGLNMANSLDNTRPIEDALNARIAELEAEVTKGHELQDAYCDRIAELEAFVGKLIETGNRLSDDREYQDDLVDIWHDVTRDWKEG